MTMKLEFVLAAVDKATAVVNGVQRTLGRLGQFGRGVGRDLAEVWSREDVQRLRNATSRLAENSAAVMAWGQGIAMAATGAAAALGGVYFGMKRTIDSVDQMLDQSKQLGISVEQFQRLGFAADQNGSSQQAMAQALQFLSQNMVEAQLGSKETIAWFDRVGISMAQMRQMDVVQVFQAIGDKFQAVGDDGLNAAKKIAAMKALMGRGGADLKQVLELGGPGIRDAMRQLDRLKAVVSTETAERMAQYNDSLGVTRTLLFGVAATAASGALPALEKIALRVQEWTEKNRQLIGTKLEEFFTRLADRMPAILDSLAEFLGDVKDIASAVNNVVQVFGGWDVAIKLLAGVIIAKAVFALGLLAASLYGVAAAFMATPLGLTITLTAAIAAAAAPLMKNWSQLPKFFKDLWDGITTRFQRFVDFLSTSDGFKLVTKVAGLFGGGGAPTVASPIGAGGAGGQGKLGAPASIGGGKITLEVVGTAPVRVTKLTKDNGSLLDLDVDFGMNMARP